MHLRFSQQDKNRGRSETWRVIARGGLEQVEYIGRGYGSILTLVRFQDDRTIPINGFLEIPYPRGTRIAVLEEQYTHIPTVLREDS